MATIIVIVITILHRYTSLHLHWCSFCIYKWPLYCPRVM
jgi:hypothetical protein